LIRKFKKWLIENFLPEQAAAAVYGEIYSLRSQVDEYKEELREERHKRERLESYCCGLDRALRSRQMNITVKGGAEHGP
jgi:hypothetical protein